MDQVLLEGAKQKGVPPWRRHFGASLEDCNSSSGSEMQAAAINHSRLALAGAALEHSASAADADVASEAVVAAAAACLW